MAQLDDRFGELYEAILLLTKPNNSGVADIKNYEELLSTFKPGDVGYELASRMRIIWRISVDTTEPVRLGEEALAIAREASPSLGPESVAFFEVVAAIQANRPHIALSTVMTLANSLVERAMQIDTGDITVDQVRKMFPNLARCRSALSDSSAFVGVSERRYRNTILYLDNLLAGYPGPTQ